MKKFEVWKTVKIGICPLTVNGLLRALERIGCVPDNPTQHTLECPDFCVSRTQITLKLVKVTLSDLDFLEAPMPFKVLERAKDFGLKSCPAEMGPRLRLQYTDQPDGEFLTIGMKSIWYRGLKLFEVGCLNGALNLCVTNNHPFGIGTKWIFSI